MGGSRRVLLLARLALRRPELVFKRWWTCPVCSWRGPFLPFNERPHARCPGCTAMERHRLQHLVLDRLWAEHRGLRILHVAPEPAMATTLRSAATHYVTLDLAHPEVDVRADLCRLPFADGALDLVFASHVLEHISEDRLAIGEIHRVIQPGGSAVLPVPVAGERTLEYGAPRKSEHDHVRQPGRDYFERYRAAGFEVEILSSADFEADRFQLRVFTPTGEVVDDEVPICRKPG